MVRVWVDWWPQFAQRVVTSASPLESYVAGVMVREWLELVR